MASASNNEEETAEISKKMAKANLRNAKKTYRKVCKSLKEFGGTMSICDNPTPYLYVGNGGMLNGVLREHLLEKLNIYGKVRHLSMIPQKSFALVSFDDTCSSTKVVDTLTGINLSTNENQPPALLFFTYLDKIVGGTNEGSYSEDEFSPGTVVGLKLKCDFVDSLYAAKLFKYFYRDPSKGGSSMKHRSVQHFGYEFLYTTNNVDQSNPLDEKIPQICDVLLEKCLLEGIISEMPDQLTVNQYEPGQGIPAHVDTHSAFEDTILSLTLGSQVVMEFKHPTSGETKAVVLHPRSLLVMQTDARYLWTHGITPRRYDIIYTSDDTTTDTKHLSLRERNVRISLTFRKIRHTPCNCQFPTQCDSQQQQVNKKSSLYVPLSATEAWSLEKEHVCDVYEEIAEHFSDTRHSPWPHVKQFLCSLTAGSIVADVGCGNGKYLGVGPQIMTFGSDRSFNLANICMQRHHEVCVSDCLNLPYRAGNFDAAISIAVIHHMSTEERRLCAIAELVRIVRKGGRVLIYVWAIEQEEERKILGKQNKGNKHNWGEKDDILSSNNQKENMDIKEDDDKTNDLKNSNNPSFDTRKNNEIRECRTIEVSEGRNLFQQQDLLVPWHLQKDEKIYHRFYHVFVEGELQKLCEQLPNVSVENIYFDRGNWCVILNKIV